MAENYNKKIYMKSDSLTKIIFSTYDFVRNPYYRGGGAYAIQEVAQRLSKRYNILVITGNYRNGKNVIVHNVKYQLIGTDLFGPKFGQLIFQLLLPFYVLTSKFDIWFESFTPPYSTGFLQLFTRKPVVGVTHFLNAHDKSIEYNLPFYLIEKIGIKTYKYFISLTSFVKSKIHKINKTATIFTIPNGIEKYPKKYLKKKSKKYGLFIGRLEVHQKGLNLLLEVFNNISSTIDDNLLIAGHGTSKEIKKIENIIHNYHLSKRVKLIGRVRGKVKMNYLAEAKYIILPSRFETFSLVALEAIAVGKPILCFDIPGLKWLDSGIAIKAHPYNMKELAQNIIKVSQDEKLRNHIKKIAIKKAEEYSWVTVAKQYREVIEQLTN